VKADDEDIMLMQNYYDSSQSFTRCLFYSIQIVWRYFI